MRGPARVHFEFDRMTLVGTTGRGREPLSFAGATEAASTPAGSCYRADIDGLRAIAVLAVVMLHSGIAGFSGGFVGVDIFFVISGYLIHRDLTKSLAERRFSLLAFYGRRLRRTVPALYLVAGTTLVASACVMVPGDLDAAARSLFPTLALVSNIHFWRVSDYFDAESLAKPLLHGWSLGVEAQFYLVAPLLALGLHALGRRMRAGVLGLAFLLALGGAVALHRADWGAGFFLAPPRLFEFLIGVVLAEGVVPRIERAWLAEIAGVLALLTIGSSVVLFAANLPHPGVPTLAPCLAAAAIIHVGSGTRRTMAGRLLALRPMAFVGLVSYSIYLWHWPVLVLTHVAGIDETPVVMAAQAFAVLALSVLTWRFVEVPFRTAGSIWRRRLPWLLPSVATSLAGFAIAIVLSSGWPQRFRPDVAAVAAYYDRSYDAFFRRGQCFLASKNSLAEFDRPACLRLDPDRPNVLLIGDSHAAQLYPALRDGWPRINLLQATASGCKPELDTTGPYRCTALLTEMLTRFIPEHRLDALVIAGLWEEADVAPLKRTIAAISPSVGRIVVFGPLPRYDMPVATLLARGMMRGSFDDVPSHLYDWVAPLDRRLDAEIAPIATYVSPWRTLCGSGRCRLFAAPGVPLQFDFNHLTPAGAATLMAMIRAERPALLASPLDIAKFEPEGRRTVSR